MQNGLLSSSWPPGSKIQANVQDCNHAQNFFPVMLEQWYLQ